MYRPFIWLIAAAALTASPSNSEPAAQLLVTAQAAVVEVEALADGRRFLPLQALEFTLTIEPQCAPDMQPESISISVADTRRTYARGDFAENPVLETQLVIPRNQVSPLAVQNFCQTDREAYKASTEMHIEDAFSANISLRCAGEEKHSISYAVQSLDLRLQCNAAKEAPDPSVDQAASPPPSTR